MAMFNKKDKKIVPISYWMFVPTDTDLVNLLMAKSYFEILPSHLFCRVVFV